MKKLIKNLGAWILIAMVAGVAAGVAMGEKATMFAPFGTLFIQLIKMLVVPLVAVSIISGAASLGSSRSAGKIGVTSIAYILFTTVISILLAMVVGFICGFGIRTFWVTAIWELVGRTVGTLYLAYGVSAFCALVIYIALFIQTMKRETLLIKESDI